MELPALLIDKNVRAALQIVNAARAATTAVVDFDASGVVAIEPVAACALAVAARAAKVAGRQLRIRGLSPELRRLVSEMECEIDLGDSCIQECDSEALTATMAVPTSSRANEAANRLADRIARFIPREDRDAMLLDHYGVRIHNAIQPALAHVLSELVDNVFSHAVTTDFPDPSAWLVVQAYRSGDLMKVAVVDDGAGLLGSMRGVEGVAPKNHFEATVKVFEPFVSSKSARALYAERRHMGLGLTVCREICQRLDGLIYAVSGNAWVSNPGLTSQRSQVADPSFQGTIISLEFHRRAVTTNMLSEVLSKLSGSANLRLRFE